MFRRILFLLVMLIAVLPLYAVPTIGGEWTILKGEAEFSPRLSAGVTTLADTAFLLGGFGATAGAGAEVWSSTNGADWSAVTLSAEFGDRYSFSVVSFDSKLWAISGANYSGTENYNDAWHSTDGVEWVAATRNAAFPGRQGAGVVVFAGKMWIIGGLTVIGATVYNDVWYSTDGVDWVAATRNAAFPARYNHAVYVSGGKLWVVSGNTNPTAFTALNDAWYSEDGETWTASTLSAAFTARDMASYFTDTDGVMWLGFGRNTLYYPTLTDLWKSSDGETWTAYISASNTVSARAYASAFMLNGNIYLTAGFNSSFPVSTSYNDVYYITPLFSLVKTQSKAIVNRNDYLTYWLHWSVIGSLTNAKIQDYYDRSTLNIISVSPVAGTTFPYVQVSLGNVADTSSSVTIVARVKSTAVDGTIVTNTAYFQAEGVYPYPEAVITAVVGVVPPTSTITRTQSVTLTPTRTPTFTITRTHTISPTITETWTITETATISSTPTVTATVTETITETPTVTSTSTPRDTPTPNLTPHYYFSSLDVFQYPTLLSVTTTTGILVVENDFPAYGVPMASLRSGPLTPSAAVDVQVRTTTAYTTFTVVDMDGNTVDCSYPYAIIDYIVLRKRSNFPWW